MNSFEFEAFGTRWAILTDNQELKSNLKKSILKETENFDNRFSRFKTNNEIDKLRNQKAGTYIISNDLAKILEIHDKFRKLTKDKFDPAVGGLLEKAGYDQKYSFTQRDISSYKIPKWSLHKNKLSISGPIVFDFGGIGKGYWIDNISKMLNSAGYKNHLVDGGRDIFATTKSNGSGWKIAIEWPGKPGIAIGTVMLKNQGFAASNTVTRSWGNWHHLIDIQKKLPRQNLLGSVAITHSALSADQMTSALALCEKKHYEKIAQKYSAQYLLFSLDGKIEISQNWSGELF